MAHVTASMSSLPLIPLDPDQHSLEFNSCPVYCLPFDIIYKIFLLLHTEEPNRFRFTASHVSRRWRSAAFDCSIMWTKIGFNTYTLSWEKQEEFIRRSGNAGLEIVLTSVAFRFSSIQTLRRVMRMLLPHTNRWKSLVVRRLPFKILRILMDALRHSTLPILETLKIEDTPVQGKWKDPTLSWTTPSLKYLLLRPSPFSHSSPIFDNLFSLSIQLSNNGRIHADDAAHHLRDLLARSPTLQSLESLDLPDPTANRIERHNIQHNPSIQSHNKLERLQAKWQVATPLFDMVGMPSLSTWVTTPHYNPYAPPQTSVPAEPPSPASFITLAVLAKWTVACKIKSMHIVGVDPAREKSTLREALKVLPKLHTLSLERVDFNNCTWPSNISVLCPSLSFIKFSYCSGLTGLDILNAVRPQTKSETVPSVRRVDIHGHPLLININEECKVALRAVLDLRLQENVDCWTCIQLRTTASSH